MSKPREDSATALIHDIHREHSKKDAPLDVNTTGGIQRTLAMHWEAIRALADRMDGRSEADTQPAELLPAERPYRAESEHAV